MNGYLWKIVCIFMGIFFVDNLGLAISWGYLGSNSIGQMKYFGVQGVIAWLCCLIVGTGIVAFLANPVSVGLYKLEQGTITDNELQRIIVRNGQLPIINGVVDVFFSFVLCAVMKYIYASRGLGPISSYSLWIAVASVVPVLLAIVYAMTTLVTNRLTDQFKKECAKRSLAFPIKPASVTAKFFGIFMLCFIALTMWMLMISFYESFYRVQETLKDQTLYAQQVAIERTGSRMGAKMDLAVIKSIADDLSKVGTSASFVMDRNARMIYNPKESIIVTPWEDINETVFTNITQGIPFTLYENVHEQVIAVTPVNGSYSIGSTRSIHDRKSNFKQFFHCERDLGLGGSDRILDHGVLHIQQYPELHQEDRNQPQGHCERRGRSDGAPQDLDDR